MNPAIKRLPDSEILAVKELLADQGLPTDDCQQQDNQFFGIYEQGQLIACGGVQAAGSFALLRSVAVADTFKGKSLGRKLVDFLLQHAAQSGFSKMYCLTETASHYFQSIGFEHIKRSAVPRQVAATEQFKSLCPASADCLMKVLEASETGANPCR